MSLSPRDLISGFIIGIKPLAIPFIIIILIILLIVLIRKFIKKN